MSEASSVLSVLLPRRSSLLPKQGWKRRLVLLRAQTLYIYRVNSNPAEDPPLYAFSLGDYESIQRTGQGDEADQDGTVSSRVANTNYTYNYNTSLSYTYSEPSPSKARSRMGRSASIVLATLSPSSSSTPRPIHILQFVPSTTGPIPSNPHLLHPMSSSAPSSGDLAASLVLPSTCRSSNRIREVHLGSDDAALVEEWQLRFQKAMSSREIRSGNILDRVLLRLDYSHYSRKSLSSHRLGPLTPEGGTALPAVSSTSNVANPAMISSSSPSSFVSSVASSRTASPSFTRPSTAEGRSPNHLGSSPTVVIGHSPSPTAVPMISHGQGHSPNSLTISHSDHRTLHPSTLSPLSGVAIPTGVLGLAYLTEDEDRMSRSISPIQQAVARRREARQHQQHLQRLRERRSMPALRERNGEGDSRIIPPVPPPLPHSHSGGKRGIREGQAVVKPTEDDGNVWILGVELMNQSITRPLILSIMDAFVHLAMAQDNQAPFALSRLNSAELSELARELHLPNGGSRSELERTLIDFFERNVAPEDVFDLVYGEGD
ncbi:hypothetical protein BJ684DRAFT_16821, partial [Piptocephalis cylindrospora]